MLDADRFSVELPAWTDRLADLLTDADPHLPVPTAPEWTLAALADHVGVAMRWMTTIVITRATEPVPNGVFQGRPAPTDAAAVPDWLREGAGDLVDAVRTVGPETSVWSWAGGSSPTLFWLRRMTYEVVVHAADAALGLGQPVSIEADLAADGIDEWLEVLPFVHAATDRPGLPAGRSMHLHAAEAELGPAGEWSLRGTDGGLSWEHAHAKADVAVRAGAGSLLLLLNRRLPADDPRFAVFGDRTLLDTWLAASVF